MEYTYIRAYRKRLGWTQKQLADASGIHRSTIAEIELRHHNPKQSELAKIAATLGVTVEQLYIQP